MHKHCNYIISKYNKIAKSMLYYLVTLLSFILSRSCYSNTENSDHSEMASYVESIKSLMPQIKSIMADYGAIITVFLSAIFIIAFARRKTYRGYSFKIRTSLNNIEGYSKLLRSEKLGNLSDEQKKYIDEIIKATSQISNVINNIEQMQIHSANKDTSFNLRSALMEINAYCNLTSNTQPALNPSQKDCLREIHEGSNLIIKTIS